MALLKNLHLTETSIGIIALTCLVFLILGFLTGGLITRLKLARKIKAERADALKKSRAVLRGQIFEELCPYFPDFPVNPKCLKFLGKPVDYVAFIGKPDAPEQINEIIFIEIKAGTSNLTPAEKSIKEAIAAKRVRFIEYRAEHNK